MKQSGNGGQGQAHCIKRNSKSFFMCRTASWRSASKLESTLLATIPLFPQNFSISIYRAGMTLGAVGICFHVVLLGEGITCLHYIVNTLKMKIIFRGEQRKGLGVGRRLACFKKFSAFWSEPLPPTFLTLCVYLVFKEGSVSYFLPRECDRG